jgi:ferrochelatase
METMTSPADRDGALGVLLLHMGGPRDQREVRPFLYRLFADPDMIRLPTPARLPLAVLISLARARAARERYALMGGGSPSVPQVTALAQQVEAALRETEENTVVEPAFLYCGQNADAALARLVARGARRFAAVPEYPQYSATTTGASLRALARALRRAQPPVPRTLADFPAVRTWHDAPLLVEMWADSIGRALADGFPPGAKPYLLFSAHGLPESYVRRGDPYEREVRASVAAIAARFPQLDHGLAFQSRVGPVKWLGPNVVQETARLAAAGRREILLVAISFLTDHVETLVELDVELARDAAKAGVTRLVRAPAPATFPLAARALAAAVLAADGARREVAG